MFELVIVVLAVVAVGSVGGVAAMAARATRLSQRLKELDNKLLAAGNHDEATRIEIDRQRRTINDLQKAAQEIQRALDEASAEDKRKTGWLDHQEQEITWLRAELEKRPKVMRKTYKILTVGVKWTGKTSLTLKWANPLTDLGTLQGTKIERYERTVSQVPQKDVTTEHVFEVGDWGGEHIVDAQQELAMEEIHGLLIVVDLGGKDAKRIEQPRIQEQLTEFQAQVLRFFFGPRTVASCKTVVLFINKSDLLSGTPVEVEEQARKHYARLIDDLMKYANQVDVRVLVGSANYGHSTHHLFAHFVEKILPRNAYDNQLLQRMKADLPPAAGRPPGKS